MAGEPEITATRTRRPPTPVAHSPTTPCGAWETDWADWEMRAVPGARRPPRVALSFRFSSAAFPASFWAGATNCLSSRPLTIHWYGVLVALAFCRMWTAACRAPLIGISGEHIADLVVPWLLLGGIFGARTMFIVTYWQDEFAGKPWWKSS